MSSERDTRRYAARRASLYEALREGDTVLAARAASRLRVDGYPFPVREFARGRAVRKTLGLALLKARLGKRLPPAPPLATPARRPRTRRGRVLATALAMSTLLLVLLLLTNTNEQGGGSAPPAAAAEPDRVIPATVLSRGRTISLIAEVVAAEESPTPSPSAVPTETPKPLAASNPGAGSGGGSSGGAGSGSGGSGGNGGSGNAAPTPTPSPAPTATPPLPPAGFTRLNVVVYDYSTLRPLPDVCVVIGTLNCDSSAPHTNVLGRYSADVAASSASTKWDLAFIRAGYVTQTRQITLPGGVARTYIIYLRRAA